MELLEKHFDIAFAAPDGIKRLRELILTLAMQGMLVPQDPSDQPASELLKEIETEKKRLVKAGKIKVPKPLPEIRPQEVPYELPQGWTWVRLGTVAEINGGFAFKSSKYSNDGVRVVRISDFDEKGFKNDRIVRYPYSDDLNSFSLEANNILMAMTGGTVGKSLLVKSLPEPMVVNQRVACIKITTKITPEFINYLIRTNLIQTVIQSAKNSTNDNISMGDITGFFVPLPPIAEQRRIVARIDQLMARCDELEKLRAEREQKRIDVHTAALNSLLTAQETDSFTDAWQFITHHFGELYSVRENVIDLRKAILQLAVMGRLVPQDPNDQPASALLKEIEAEKKRLVKAGKIKTPKPLPEITPEEVPYALPQGWEWVRFFAVNTVKSELVLAKDFPLENQIAPDSIEKGSGRLLFHRTVEESGAIGPNNRFYEGQILYSKIRPSLNKAVIAPYDGLCSADMYPTETHINAEFMLRVILSETFLVQVRQAENRVKMPKLNLESLGLFVIPLPPLAEQRRIVARIEQLMTLCDDLDQQIDAVNGKQKALLNCMMART